MKDRLSVHILERDSSDLDPKKNEVEKSQVIDHGFYSLLVMVYKCFKIYLLLYRVYLE